MKTKTVSELLKTDSEQARAELKRIGPPPMPTSFEDCSRSELEWLSEHGSYGQRLIAKRFLKNTPCN